MMPVAVRATSRGPRIEACGEKSGRREWRLVVFLPRIAIQCMECLLFVCLLWARFQLVLLPTWTERFGRARPADRARHAAGGSHCCCRRGGPQSREGRRLYYRLLVMSPPFQLSDRGSLSGAGLCVAAGTDDGILILSIYFNSIQFRLLVIYIRAPNSQKPRITCMRCACAKHTPCIPGVSRGFGWECRDILTRISDQAERG
jgi:hypothetical protein